jgi:hypothetical protein
MRETRLSGSAGGGVELNRPFLPRSAEADYRIAWNPSD